MFRQFGTKAQLLTKSLKFIQMQNSNSSAGTNDQLCNEVEVAVDVHHHNAKPLVSGCCSNGGISKVYLIDNKDCKVENGILKIKRKYGKYKRVIKVIDYNNR